MLRCVTVGHVCVVVCHSRPCVCCGVSQKAMCMLWCVTVGHVCVVVCHSRPCVCCGVSQ